MTSEGKAVAIRTPVVTRRAVREEDAEFLLRVYASTRAEELAMVPWSDTEKEAFVRFQFDAQDRHYRTHYPDASFEVLLVDGVSAGRLYVDRRPDDIRVIDIALLPQHRGDGIGSRLLGDLLDEAERSGRKVSIHVERFNRAKELYERLGFTPVANYDEVYVLMEWVRPSERSTP